MTWDNEERFVSDKGRIEYQRQRAEKAGRRRSKNMVTLKVMFGMLLVQEGLLFMTMSPSLDC